MEACLADFFDIQVGSQHVFVEQGRSGHELAARSVDRAAAVEDQVILAADEVAVERQHGIVGGARGQHLLALPGFARVEWRAVDVDDHLRPSQALILHGAGGIPDVFADGHADPRVTDLEELHARSGPEVAGLVEDAVVGQVLLVVDACLLAVVEDGGGVEDIVRIVDVAHHGRHVQAACGIAHLLQRGQICFHEPAPQDEIFRRVAGQRQLGEGHQICTQRLGFADAVNDLVGVAFKIADGRVGLG